MKQTSILLTTLLLLCWCGAAHSQNKPTNLVYVDKQGVMRYTKDKSEATFFGVNYTVPFAYGYRSHKALGVDLEAAIDKDVYHMARLGLDAFRVHVWDTEITDTAGNLIANEHLRLFDYLVAKLKERKIKILITPIAFWGTGYPEPDPKTPGFSGKYGKSKALVNDTAIAAQENYLKQFFQHVNPYTKLTYGNDVDVIAMEINNEPHHSGPKNKVTEYVNRMVAAVKSTGWTKPVFYNISESPGYADAVAKANIDGVSFQWYPTGLVANRTLQGNYLQNVDEYKIPFGDTIPLYRNKARMVYEFDAGDVLQSNMYPAMARSFRTAGFQWATQFAYDPMATAYGNTEYQTHYVNLAYTPSKAISLMIASEVFHKVPRLKSYGAYPADSSFESFRVSYKNDLSEMNSEDKFYYSNTTSTQPKNTSTLKHIAGVGSSSMIKYNGSGAYFLDKLGDGVWRLEVMPDAVFISDPFARASPKKEVAKIVWQVNQMQIDIANLGKNFSITGMNLGNNTAAVANGKTISIAPGTYELRIQNARNASADYSRLNLKKAEFVAPKSPVDEPILFHVPYEQVSAGKQFVIKARIAGVDSSDRISVEIRNSANKWRTVQMKKLSSELVGEIPADMVVSGVINYRIIIQKKNGNYFVFPGYHKGNPFAWDNHNNETWETFVANEKSDLQIFDPNVDRTSLNLFNSDWRNNTIQYKTGNDPKQLILMATMTKPTGKNLFGWQTYFAGKTQGRASEINSFSKVVVKAKADMPTKVKITFITADASAFSTFVTLGNLGEIAIPVSDFKSDSSLLLPRPYPGFLPLWFKGKSTTFNIADAEKLEITFGHDVPSAQLDKPISIEIESVWLKNN